MSRLRLKEESSAVATPASGTVVFYAKTDGLLYFKDDTGTEYRVKPIGGGTGDLLSDGSVPLVADWDVGSFEVRARTFESDVATGTAPFTVASTTVVTNLNADKVDGADLIDEDNMASDSAVHVPTQQSVKAYVDAAAGARVANTLFDANTILKADADNTPAALTVAEQTLVGRITAGSITALSATQVRTLLNVENGATADMTGAEIKVAYEAEADTNAFTDAEQTKLSGVEALADVTDATNVAAAGAVMDGDFTAAGGFMRKVSAGTYEAIKSNLAAAVAPAVTDDSGDGYAVGSTWIDTTGDKIYFCLDATVGAAVWQEVGAGTGSGGMTVTPVKTANYTANENEVVPVDSSGGAFTVTMPASAAAQARVIVADVGKACSANNVTLGRNGATFDGAAADFVIDQDNGRVDAMADGADDWATHLIGSPNLVNAGGMTLLGTATVAGSAATTLTLSGLDLSAYSAFKITVKLKNPTGSTTNVSLYYNADTTATNYYSQASVASSTTHSAARGNNAVFVSVPTTECADGEIQITSDVDGKARAIANFSAGFSGIALRQAATSWTTAANVTSITLSSSVASALGIGSTFSVWGIS